MLTVREAMADNAIRADARRLYDEEVLPVFAGIGMGERGGGLSRHRRRKVLQSVSQSSPGRNLHQSRGQEAAPFRRPDRTRQDERCASETAAAASGACFRIGRSRTPHWMTSRSSKRSTLRATGDANGVESGLALINGGSLMKTMLIAAAVAMAAALSAPTYAADAADHPDHRQGHHVVLLADRARRRPQGRQGSRRQRAGARRPVRIRHQRPDLDPRERRRRQAGRHRHLADPIQGARQADRRSRQEGARSSASTPPPTPRPSPRS